MNSLKQIGARDSIFSQFDTNQSSCRIKSLRKKGIYRIYNGLMFVKNNLFLKIMYNYSERRNEFILQCILQMVFDLNPKLIFVFQGPFLSVWRDTHDKCGG